METAPKLCIVTLYTTYFQEGYSAKNVRCSGTEHEEGRPGAGAAAVPLGLALAEGGFQVNHVVAHVQALLLHLLRLVHHRLQVALQLSGVALQRRQLSVPRRHRDRHARGTDRRRA